MMTQGPDLIMETDASLMGWGAVCRGIRTGGLWSQLESKNHINYLELLAAMFAVKSFAKDRKDDHIHLRPDHIHLCFSLGLDLFLSKLVSR